MNVLFHLIPKEKVAYINLGSTLRQAMEKMEYHRYTAVPILDDDGKYVGVIGEGDILWYIKNLDNYGKEVAEKTSISSVPRRKDHNKVNIMANLDELIDLAIEQNFIPIVDDRDTFIGIITRKTIIKQLAKKNGL